MRNMLMLLAVRAANPETVLTSGHECLRAVSVRWHPNQAAFFGRSTLHGLTKVISN